MLRETFASRSAAAETGEAWCPACAAVSPLLTAEDAAAFGGVAWGSAFVGAGVAHFVEAGGLAPLVCLRSLLPSGGRTTREGAGGRREAKVLNFRRGGESG